MIGTEVRDSTDSNNQQTQRMNPWLTMWFRPRATIRNLIDTATEFKGWLLVVVFSGVGQSLGDSWMDADAATSSIGRILLTSTIYGILFTLIHLTINCVLIHKIGQFMGGKASRENVFLALGWSGVPFAWSLLIWVPSLFLSGERLFNNNALSDSVSTAEIVITAFLLLFYLGLFVWTMILLCKCISELQGFSIWKAILNVLLALATVALPFYLLLSIWR